MAWHGTFASGRAWGRWEDRVAATDEPLEREPWEDLDEIVHEALSFVQDAVEAAIEPMIDVAAHFRARGFDSRHRQHYASWFRAQR